MTKFGVAEIYTPDDRRTQRNIERCTFHSDSKDWLELAKAAMGCFGHDDFFEEFKDEITDQLKDQAWSDDPDDNGYYCDIISFYSNDGEYAYEINQIPSVSGTPITDENIVAWAENRVALNPTYEDSVWDPEKPEHKRITKTNTVERELGLVIHQHVIDCFTDYRSSELREQLADLLWSGTKGYSEMTREELLREINDKIVSNFEAETIEELPYFKDDES